MVFLLNISWIWSLTKCRVCREIIFIICRRIYYSVIALAVFFICVAWLCLIEQNNLLDQIYALNKEYRCVKQVLKATMSISIGCKTCITPGNKINRYLNCCYLLVKPGQIWQWLNGLRNYLEIYLHTIFSVCRVLPFFYYIWHMFSLEYIIR